MNTFNFIEEYKLDDAMCDNFIKYFKKNTESKKLGATGATGIIDTTIKK